MPPHYIAPWRNRALTLGHSTRRLPVKALVSIAAPWTGAPKALRVLFSGDEMVSQYIIHDADTRDFSRAMSATYMLLPDERVFGNHTVLSLVGGDSTLGMSSMHGASSGSARFDKLTIDSEHYRARRGELRSLFSKVEAHVPQTAARMRAMYDRSLRLVDVWTAPPVPVVCVIGSGKPTMVGYLYREPWPKNMDEEPCPLGYEDGDVTVPVRSAETICRHWQQQKRCHSPLVTAQPTMYRGKNDECVDINYMHCRSANMESADTPRGGDHCTELHSRILHKNSLIDLVQSIAFNPRAFEPGHGVSLERVDEFVQVLAWLYNSAAQRLPQDAAFVAALAAAGFHAQSPSDAGASTRADEGAGADADTDADATLAALTSSLATLRARSTYEDILRALQRLTVAVRERVQHAISEASGSTERSSEAGGEDDARVADAGQRDGGGDAINVGGDAIASAVAAAVLGVADAMAPLLQASNAMGAALDGVSKARGRAANGRRASGAPSPSATADTAEAPPSTCAVGGATADAAVGMLGLPDCVDAYEAASFSSYRSATLDDEELRRSAADAKKRMRALRDAITHLEPPLHEMRSQVAWCEHHWNALTRLLGEPEPRPQDLELSKPDYESSLYGKMQGDDLLAS